MDRGAWRTTAHRVTRSWAGLSTACNGAFKALPVASNLPALVNDSINTSASALTKAPHEPKLLARENACGVGLGIWNSFYHLLGYL